MVNLRPLEILLPEWKESDFAAVTQAEKRLTRIAKGAGQGSDAFKSACKRLLEIALNDHVSNIGSFIDRPVDVRAFTYLIAFSDVFASRISISETLLKQLLIPRSPLSKLSLIQMIRSFFVRYDSLAIDESMINWCDFIQSQLSTVESHSESSDIVKYAKSATISFSPAGPMNVVNYAKSNEIDFDAALEKLGLTGFADGRFIKLCRYQYYLETLNSITVGSEHPILSEIVKDDVVRAPYSEGRLLGHAIIKVLIDRSEGQVISQAWQSSILSIAGDPRVPKSNASYQQWWSLLGDERVALMRGWLSKFDLKLFLNILEQSAKDGINSDMERMFESRKVFMEGLLRQEFVIDSRLFLSNYAEKYLLRHYEKKELPEYARVASHQTSMIYLNLSGKVHMIEGSHSFKLKLLDSLPSNPGVSDYGVKLFSDSELRKGLIFQYKREFFNNDGWLDLTHDVHLGWQNKAIDFMRTKGVSAKPSEMIKRDRYREYKSKFGAH